MEFITQDDISKIKERIETDKEVSFITKDSKENYDFENKMPSAIASKLLDESSFDKDVKSIGSTAQKLLEGM